MGTSINLTYQDIDVMVNKIEKYKGYSAAVESGKMEAMELLDKIMPKFGLVEGNNFITICNEYYDTSPDMEFMHLIDRYYGFDGIYIPMKSFYDQGEAYEVAENLGIELYPDEDE